LVNASRSNTIEFTSIRHRENLVAAMLHGKKRATDAETIVPASTQAASHRSRSSVAFTTIIVEFSFRDRQVVALTFRATVDVPSRFTSSKAVSQASSRSC
jgi:hypothetical protein